MKINVSKIILLSFLFSLALIPLLTLNVSEAADFPTWGAKCAPSNTPTDIRQAIMNITNWVLGFVSMICVLVVMYGLVTGADTIKYGILGLVVCGLAYAMVIVVSTVIFR